MITPKNGLPDWATVVIVCGPDPNKKTVLVMDPFKKNPVYWKFPGGKSVGEETVLQTAVRELREETGLSINEANLELIEEVDKSWHFQPHTLFVFKVVVDNFDGLLRFGNETKSTALSVELCEINAIQEMKDFLPIHRKYLEKIFSEMK